MNEDLEAENRLLRRIVLCKNEEERKTLTKQYELNRYGNVGKDLPKPENTPEANAAWQCSPITTYEKLSIALFQSGKFELHSKQTSNYKIECDSLKSEDWKTLAMMAKEKLPPFGRVEGVPTGGLRLAQELSKYITAESQTLLIVDDVCTTGTSMEDHRKGREAVGLVVFTRGKCPSWVIPLWMTGDLLSEVRNHYSQKADDRCIFDDDKLYEAAGLPLVDRRVGNKEEMLKNCARFIERRCETGGWPTYIELEEKVKKLEQELQNLKGVSNAGSTNDTTTSR